MKKQIQTQNVKCENKMWNPNSSQDISLVQRKLEWLLDLLIVLPF